MEHVDWEARGLRTTLSKWNWSGAVQEMPSGEGKYAYAPAQKDGANLAEVEARDDETI